MFRETVFGPAQENVNQLAKISDDLFFLNVNILGYELCRPPLPTKKGKVLRGGVQPLERWVFGE